jgi:magnesium transporter
MISRYSHQNLTWIDLENPGAEEIQILSDEFNLHPVVANELLDPSERAKVDLYSNAIYMILHFPLRNRATGHVEEVEVDFVLLKDTLITTHYTLVDPLVDFARLFEMGNYLNTETGVSHAGHLFFFAIRELYKHTLFLVEGVGHDIRNIEHHIFSGDESAMVAHISRTNRSLIDTRQTLRYHRDTLKSFAHACTRLFGQDFGYYVSAIEGEFERIAQAAEENRQTLRELRETNDSLLQTKTNSVMRRLTAVNVIMLPLGLISWIFAMNSHFLVIDDIHELILVFAGMALICIVSIIYFRSQKWL